MRRRRGMSVGIGLCGVFVLAAAASAWAEPNPFVGKWHWDRALSKLPAGETAPDEMTAEFSRVDAAHVKWSVTIKNPRGQPVVEAYDTPANGEFYPVGPDTVASFKLSGLTLQGIFKGPAGQSDTLTCSLSDDNKKMTCNGQIAEADGKTESYIDVYERK